MITEKSTIIKKEKILRFFTKILEQKQLIKNQDDQILPPKGLMKNDLHKSIQRHSTIGEPFGPSILKHHILIPLDYNPETQVDKFFEKYSSLPTTDYYHPELISENFRKTSDMLIPGEKYSIKMFPFLRKDVSSEEAINRLQAEPRNVFAGVQGLTLLYEYAPEIFPIGKWTVSFDHKKSLWKDIKKRYRVPGIYRFHDNKRTFNLGNFEISWNTQNILLCFCHE